MAAPVTMAVIAGAVIGAAAATGAAIGATERVAGALSAGSGGPISVTCTTSPVQSGELAPTGDSHSLSPLQLSEPLELPQPCRCTELAELQPSSALFAPGGPVCAEPPFSEPFEWPARASASPRAHPRRGQCTEPAAPQSSSALSGLTGHVSASPLAHPQRDRCTEPAAPPPSSGSSARMAPASASPGARRQPCRCTEPVAPLQSSELSELMELGAVSRQARRQPCRCIEPVAPQPFSELSEQKAHASASPRAIHDAVNVLNLWHLHGF